MSSKVFGDTGICVRQFGGIVGQKQGYSNGRWEQRWHRVSVIYTDDRRLLKELAGLGRAGKGWLVYDDNQSMGYIAH